MEISQLSDFALTERIAHIQSRQQVMDMTVRSASRHLESAMYGFYSKQTVEVSSLLAGLDFEQLIDAKLADEQERLQDELRELESELGEREGV